MARKKTTTKTAPAKKTAPARPAAAVASPSSGAGYAAAATPDATAAAAPEQPAQADAPTAAPSSVSVGEVVALAPDEDTPNAPTQHVLVVGTVDGTPDRPDGALVVALPDARWIALDDLATD